MAGKILLLHCAESGTKALAGMAAAGRTLPEEVRTFELECTGRVNDALLMELLADGLEAALVVGCRRENCRYLDGNTRAERRIERVQRLLREAGVEDKAVEILLVAPDEGMRVWEAVERLSAGLRGAQESA